MVLIEDITDQRPPQHDYKYEAAAAATSAATATSGSDPSSPPPPPPTATAAEDSEEAIAAAAMEEPVDVLPSDERSLDAAEIEQLAAQLQRPTAKLHVSALVTKLHREAEALQRMEKARKLQQSPSKPGAAERKVPAATATATTDENQDPVVPVVAPDSSAASKTVPAPAAAVLSPPPVPLPASSVAAAPSLGAYYVPIDRFAFDAGGYNAPFVTLYVDLPGVGSIPRESVTCHFTKSTVDLVVRNLHNKSYRLYKDNLDKDIDPSKSKIVVKANKVLVKLAKIKSEYGSYDYWTQLTSKKAKTAKASDGKADDPSASIMQLMKDMYDDGDDNMRKVIGETMLKQQRGELGKDKDSMMGGGFGGGGMGGLKDDDDDDF